MAGRSFLPAGIEKGQPVFPAALVCGVLMKLLLYFLTIKIFKHSFDIILYFIKCCCISYATIRISGKNKTIFGFKKRKSLAVCKSIVCDVPYI